MSWPLLVLWCAAWPVHAVAWWSIWRGRRALARARLVQRLAQEQLDQIALIQDSLAEQLEEGE